MHASRFCFATDVMKTRDVGGTGAGLWMRVDGNGGALAFDNMMNRPVRGTTDWTRVSIVLDVPNDADGIALGMLLVSGGEAWVDDASFEIVGTDVALTSEAAPARNRGNAQQSRAMYAKFPPHPSISGSSRSGTRRSGFVGAEDQGGGPLPGVVGRSGSRAFNVGDVSVRSFRSDAERIPRRGCPSRLVRP